MREVAAIATILFLLGISGIEPGAVQAKSCKTGTVASLLGAC